MRCLLIHVKNSQNFQTIEVVNPIIVELAKHYPLPLISAVDEYSDRAYLAFVGISHFFKYVSIASTYT